MRLCNNCFANPAQKGRNKCRPCRYEKNERKELNLKRTTVVGNQKILMVDIETSPNISAHWGLFKQNIGVNQILIPAAMLCFAAKWYGEDEVLFRSRWEDGQQGMVEAAWRLLNEADVVIHFYGSQFDVPHLNREFLQHGLTPPRPFKQIDLKMSVSRRFRFTSNKLQFISEALGLEGKIEHEGYGLWDKVLNIANQFPPDIEQDAKDRMRVYNERDVTLLEEVYEVLLPWIPNHPHGHLYMGNGCPTCGVDDMEAAGYAYTKVSIFQQYRCANCGSFFRDTKRLHGVSLQESVL